MVPSLGNLDAYISAVNRLPMLTQPKRPARPPPARHGTSQAAGQLVLSHLRLVVSSRASTWATACRTAT
jgi:RNA polymerase sigma-32 factor